MVDITNITLLISFYGVIIASVYWLQSFVVKRSDKEISEIIDKYKMRVIANDVSKIKKGNDATIRQFYDDYRILGRLDRERDEVDNYGNWVYVIFVIAAATAILDSIYTINFWGNSLSNLAFWIAVGGTMYLINYLTTLKSIRKDIRLIERKMSERS